MKQQILNFINEFTHREKLEEKSTKQVAVKFGVETKEAYRLLQDLASENKIQKLDPVNGDKFDCCGWLRLQD